MKRYLVHLRNPFVSISLAFIVWMLFLDSNRVSVQLDFYSKVKELETEKLYYENQISSLEKDNKELLTSAATREKFAREKYRMKRENEDIFILVPKNQSSSTNE